MLVCNREDRVESKVDEIMKTHPKGLTGCKARMIASSDVGGSWIVRVVEPEHYHDLNYTNLRLLRRNKVISIQKLLNYVGGLDVRNFIDLDMR
ncbi:hypothetical protein Ahy_B02g059274 [Arachis hypogaea]|uniref:FAR1 domain-containing protein n=1 Tax=Arachis hypogaea TaxID=3818 RepID=A0A445AGD0_ARAHY|nr:hypothetical protein Ahy_B02g059274 [Arachis hypogaea]